MSSLPAFCDPGGNCGRLANLRDLGGLPARQGGRTRSGMLYRSDAPYAHDCIADQIPSWPPSDVIDLRGTRELGSRYQWPSGTSVHQVPLLAEAAPDVRQGTRDRLYVRILDDLAPHVADIVSILAKARGSVLIHCAVGKDRTGVTVAVLLTAAGVVGSAIVSDYLATGPNVDGLLARIPLGGYQVDADVRRRLRDMPPSAIEGVIAAVAGTPGGPARWLVERGVNSGDLALWRSRLFSGSHLRSRQELKHGKS